MSWADDIRCLYCDGRLPLYRKITNGQFCSSAHRKAYWQEQERLAVERLHQTHDSLHAYRPAGGIESILGRTFLTDGLTEGQEAELPAALVSPVETAPEPERPWWLLLVNQGQIPEPGLIADPVPAQPRWPSDGLAASNPEPVEYTRSLRWPLVVFEMYDCEFESAAAVELDLTSAKSPVAQVATSAGDVLPLHVMMDIAMDPVCRLALEVRPDVYELEPEVAAEPENLPPFANLLTLSHTSAVETSGSAVAPPSPEAITLRAQLPLDAVMRHATLAPAALLQAGLRQIPMDRLPVAPGPWIDSLRAVDLRAETEAPLFTLSTPPARPRLRMAAGRRYPVETRLAAAPAKGPEPGALAAKGPGITLPQRKEEPVAAASAPMFVPNAAGLVSLAGIPQASIPGNEVRPAPAALTLPQPSRTEPIRPKSKLEPMRVQPGYDVNPAFEAPPVTLSEDEKQPEIPMPLPMAELKTGPTGNERANIWIHAIDFWNRAPRDLKMLTIAIPVLLGLALHPSLPKVRVAAPATTSGIQKNFQRVLNEQFVNVRQTVLERAAVALDEDFRSGLDDWASPGDASTDWSFDATGFVRPGPLAIYKPSMGLTDYQMQFLGMIDKKAMSWVVRAADFQNFYVVKLVVLKAGPLPSIGFTRYAVVNGKADSRVDTVVPVDAREDMLYRVRMDVKDNDFSLSVQGQQIDAWSEPRLTRGGIGFFSARGEESRLRWIQVTHQYDMLGRLCAYLAPYNFSSTGNGITSTSGSWQP
jgi:hypothetical protein